MRFYSTVDLTGNLIMIEELDTDGTFNRGPPDTQLDSANLCAIMTQTQTQDADTYTVHSTQYTDI